jgi:hypothetical protein
MNYTNLIKKIKHTHYNKQIITISKGLNKQKKKFT